MPSKLLTAIEFECNNTAYRLVMAALDLLQRYADIPNTARHYDASENVPIKVLRRSAGWRRSSTRTASSSGPFTSCA